MIRPKLLLADDHTIVVESLAELLKAEFEIVRTVRDGQALIDAARNLRPEVVVSDLSMPGVGGLEAMRTLELERSRAKFIFLTMHADPGIAGEARAPGASGYVLKDSAAEELFAAIRAVLAGRTYVTPRLAGEVVLGHFQGGHAHSLSHRQRQVLQLISGGLTLKEVAAKLNLSRRTVESHKYQMMRALGVETNAGLIRYAMQHEEITC